MPRIRKPPPLHPGTGEYRCRGYKGDVDYEIQGEPASLRLGPSRLRGSMTTEPDVAEQAFRDCEGELTLEDGKTYRVTMLGHQSGSGVAYFEMRI